ncbi:MAG: hypothetical protein KIT25_05355 [Enhydrobacter sp.]|nr:MAG: hypothetical protein KIT25_05355 [Enhydrobacter sp.]
MTATLARVEAHVCRTAFEQPVRASFGIMAERVAAFVRVEDSGGTGHGALLFAHTMALRQRDRERRT